MPKMPVLDHVPGDPLELPIAGADGKVRTYKVRPTSGADWLRFSALQSYASMLESGQAPAEGDTDVVNQLNSLGVRGFREEVLGKEVLEQMLADGIDGQDLQRAATTAFVWHASGGDSDAAIAAWSGKATTTSTSTSTGEATTTS